MKEKIILRVIVTLLVGVIVAAALWLILPTWEAKELDHTTVTLHTCRYETVGFIPRGHGNGDVKALIYTASDGEEYQIAMFHKKEGKELEGQTVRIGYKENGSSYDGAHMIVELTVGEDTAYTLTDWNDFQRNRRAIIFWLWLGITVLANLPLIIDILSYFGIVKRRRRYRRNRKAHEAKLQNLQNRPRNFPDSVWRTEDGKMILTVNRDGTVTGEVRIAEGEGDRTVPISFDDTAHTTIRIAETTAGKKAAPYAEVWEADYHSPHAFTAKPRKTTYFKKGKTVTLHRINTERS